MTNSHSRGDSMRIDNHVGVDAFSCKGQVFLSVSNSACSLLSVTTGELVSYHGYFDGTHFDFDVPDFVLVGGEDD